jgi:hypothetical protein
VKVGIKPTASVAQVIMAIESNGEAFAAVVGKKT